MAPIFEPQPLAAPLNDDALKSLEDLLPQREQRAGPLQDRQPQTKRYNESRKYLKDAAELLTTLTGELNDRAYDRKTRYLKAKARRREAEAHPDEDDDEAAAAEADARHEEFQRKVETLTKKMDMSIRGVIDDINWLAEYPDTLKGVIEKAQNSAEEQRRNFEARSPTPSRRPARRRRISDDDDQEIEDGNGNEEEEEQPAARAPRSRQLPTLDPSETPHIQLTTALAQQTRQWTSMSLTDRYARDNHYKGFKKVLWDAQNPGENPPPMPHETLWFAAEEGRSTTSSFSSTQQHRQPGKRSAPTQGSNADTSSTEPGEEDDELEISAENARVKCPITLLPFKQPVTSKNCNHSYEREAILSMLENSSVPLNAQQEEELRHISARARRDARRAEMQRMQPKRVKCPESGCNIDIDGEEDLVENQVLKRRVARLLAKETQKNVAGTSDIEDEGEDEEDDGNVMKGTQRRPLGLGSSPVGPSSGRRAARILKNERISGVDDRDSVVPDSQAPGDGEGSVRQGVNGTPRSQASAARPPRGTQIVDLEDDE